MRIHLAATALRPLVLALLAGGLSGCGDGGGDGNGSPSSSLGTCGIRADVTGGTTIHFTGANDAACATQHSFDTGLDAAFLGLNAKGTLELIVDSVTEGATGDDYPTRIVVTSPAKERWQSAACLASISEHRLVKTEASAIGELRHYQVSGEGACTDPLAATPAGPDPVTLSTFAFRAQFTWRD